MDDAPTVAGLTALVSLDRLGAPRQAVVVEFDDATGLGLLEQEGGVEAARRWPFHCVAIADGSRHVEPGATVAFELGLAPGGRIEARRIVPVSASPPEGRPSPSR